MKRLKRVFLSKVIAGAVFVLMQLLFFYVVFYSLAEYSTYIFGGVNIISALVILTVINRDMDSGMKISWAFIIALVPVFAIALYYYVRLDLPSTKIKNRLRDIYDSTNYVNENDTVVLSRAVSRKDEYHSTLKYLKEYSGYFPYQNTKIEYFSLGDNAYPHILSELKKATEYIFIEFFIIDSKSEMWNDIHKILVDKVRDGVEVRVLYDGMGSLTTTSADFADELNNEGIKCEVFAPLKPFLSTYQNNRDHRKIIDIDGKTVFCGGVNLADEYINRIEKYGHWKDNAVMIKGDVVKSYTLMFLRMWNVKSKDIETFDKYINTSIDEQASHENGCVVAYDDSPFREERITRNLYIDIISSSNDYVYIMTPYLILDEGVKQALIYAAKRGVDVRIIMPHIPDKKTTFCLSRTYYPELLSNGVKIYEYMPGFVHSKTTVCDDRRCVVGTVNYDYRSMYLNYECGLYISGENSAIDFIKKDFEDTFSKSMFFDLEKYYNTPVIMRIIGRILKVIAPLM